MAAQQRPEIPQDMKAYNTKLIAELRANGGKVPSGPLAGSTPLILTTEGRNSGQPRTVIIGWRPSGEDMVVIASNNGAAEDPHWYRNLLKNPRATAEVGGRKFEVQARHTEGEERERMGALIDYLERQQALTRREIPVVILEPVEE
jgi:deazaflavin-dependent oxidoreductase (nitroreductase family)